MEEVIAAIERQDFEVALVEAVSAWRQRRHGVLADLVDAVATRCKPAPLAGRDKSAFQRAFVELAARAATSDDPAAFGALAAGLTRSVPVREIRYLNPSRDVKRNRPFIERIEALAKCADDPRIAAALADVIERAPFSVEDVGGVYGPAIDLLIRIGDERAARRLRALVERPSAKTKTIRDYFAEALPKAADAIDKALRKRRALGDDERTSATKLISQLGAKPTEIAPAKKAADVDALVADCLAHPDDDGPREVLADALLEREDPRGEFIHLQLRDARLALSEAERKQMASLQRKHEKTWLGDITRVSKLRVFRRGFLDEMELLQGAAADPATWERVAADPLLATVRTLHKGSASEQLYSTFVFSPVTRSLRDVNVTSTAMLSQLLTAKRDYEHVLLHAGLTKDALAMLANVTNIRRLSFAAKKPPREMVEQIAAWEARKQFVELSVLPAIPVNDWSTRANDWLLAFERLAPVKRLGIDYRGERVVLERGKKGVVAEIRATQEWLVVKVLATRGLAIERLVVRGTPHAWSKPTAAFAKAVKKLPAAAVDLRDGWQAYAPRR